jgi:hypothetical protein
MSRNRMAQWFAAVVVGFAASAAKADIVTFVTPTGSTSTGGDPISASATFTTSGGTLTIVLKDLQGNPKDVAQLISDLSFTVGHGGSLTGSAQTGATSQEITVNGNGTFSTGATLTTVAAVGWVYTTSSTVDGTLDVLQGPGHAGPAHLIIGPPGGPTYSNANGSIAGNGPHNPFLNQSATFTITGLGINDGTTVTAATFSFGTTEGASLIPGVLSTTPAPTPPAFVLGLIGAAGLFAMQTWTRKRTPGMA